MEPCATCKWFKPSDQKIGECHYHPPDTNGPSMMAFWPLVYTNREGCAFHTAYALPEKKRK